MMVAAAPLVPRPMEQEWMWKAGATAMPDGAAIMMMNGGRGVAGERCE